MKSLLVIVTILNVRPIIRGSFTINLAFKINSWFKDSLTFFDEIWKSSGDDSFSGIEEILRELFVEVITRFYTDFFRNRTISN